MPDFTVVAAYSDPPSIWCGDTITADNPEAAIELAWLECVAGNGWDAETKQNDEWADVMVIAGTVEVVG
jgi:hypothetical protein